MPFIITTPTPARYTIHSPAADAPALIIEAKRFAVAELTEQHQDDLALYVGERRIATDPEGDHEAAWPAWDAAVRAVWDLLADDAGGTITLPNGTVIEVEPVTALELFQGTGRGPEHREHMTVDQQAVAAFNAAQEGDR
jgi:hypothetical protein